MDPNRLKEIPIFSHLSNEEAKRLAAFATETSLADGQILMKQGDYSTELIAIQEGTAVVIQDGKTIASLAEGDLIGEMGLIDREPRNADVIRDGQKIASLKNGDLIGEMGLLSREPRSADVIATSPMRVIKLTHWEIRRMSADTIERIEQIISERRQAGVADPAH